MPIAAAYAKETWTPSPDGVSTVAGGIAVEQPPRLRQVLEALEDTKGRAVAVDEKEIIYWQRQLSNREGIFVEPTSAATLAGLSALIEEGHILPAGRCPHCPNRIRVQGPYTRGLSPALFYRQSCWPCFKILRAGRAPRRCPQTTRLPHCAAVFHWPAAPARLPTPTAPLPGLSPALEPAGFL